MILRFHRGSSVTKRIRLHPQSRMTNRNKVELLNSKNEFNHPPIARITYEKKNIFKKSTQSSVPKNYQYANQTLSAQSSSLSGKEPILNAVKTSSYI